MTGRDWRRVIVVALAVAAGMCGLAALSGGFAARIGGADHYAQFLSKYRVIAETWRAGRLPLWNPWEYAGVPLLATGQSAALYAPLVVVNMLLPPVGALQAIYDLHIAVLVLFTIVYVRSAGIGLAPAAAGAALAAACLFNGLANIGIDHPNYLFSITYVPALLLAWTALLGGRATAAAAVALVAGLQWYPGYPELPLETAVLFAVTAALGRGWTLPRRVVVAGALLALGALVAAAQLLPLAEAMRETTRVDSGSFHVFRALFAVQGSSHLLTTSLARYGAAGLFCLGLGLLKPSRFRWIWAAGLVWATFATNRPFVWLYTLWPYSEIRFAFGWNNLAPFFAACLAASGLERLRRDDTGRLAPALAGALAALALAVGQRWAAASAAACALATAPPVLRRGGRWIPLALVALHVVGIMGRIGSTGPYPAPDLAALAPRVAALRRLHETLPERPRVVSGPEVRAGLTLAERLPSPSGHEPAQPPRRMVRVGQRLGLERLALGSESASWKELAAYPGTAAALGIGVVALPPAQATPLLAAGYTQAARLPGGDIALYRRPMPRFHLVHRVTVAADEEESFRRFTDPAFDPFTTAIVEAPDAAAIPVEPASGEERVELTGETPEDIRLRATSTAAAVLVIADNYFPGWEARVDGAPVPVRRVDYTLRGIPLAAGTHDVDLAYRPRAVWLGALVTVAALAATAALFLHGRGM